MWAHDRPMALEGRDRVEVAGVVLALVAGGLHLVWGLPRALVYALAGTYPDPRPFLFVASAVAVAAAAVWLARGGPRRPLLGTLAAVVAAYLLGYAGWHLGSHGGALFPGLTPLRHGGSVVATLLDHLGADAFVLVTTVVEVAALAALLASLAMGDGSTTATDGDGR